MFAYVHEATFPCLFILVADVEAIYVYVLFRFSRICPGQLSIQSRRSIPKLSCGLVYFADKILTPQQYRTDGTSGPELPCFGT